MTVSVIIVNYNGGELLIQAIASFQQWVKATSYEIILVDNASRDGSVERVKQLLPQVNVLLLENNVGFGRANNAGARAAQGKYLLFLNSDTIIREDMLTPLVSFLEEHESAAVVGPKLLNPDGTIQLSYGNEPGILGEAQSKQCRRKLESKHPHVRQSIEQKLLRQQEVDWLTGAAMLVRRSVFDSLGGFDEDYFMYFEDADFCTRVRKAEYKVVYFPETSLIHIGGKSVETISDTIAVEYRRSQLLFYHKHRNIFSRGIVRVYLFVKFGFKYLWQRQSRHINKEIVLLALRASSLHCRS
jgi:GT2 family glycosyltransferase